ncbi:hypothetical protein L2E82_53756 [Cichorium intybus]|nr:hypothetical protein L2E82_53756 [Cichorium intybus]
MTKRERFPALKKKDLREEQFLISKAAYHKHPTPYDLLGGRSPFESNKGELFDSDFFRGDERLLQSRAGNSRGSPLGAFAAKKEAEWRKERDKGGLAWREGCWFGGRSTVLKNLDSPGQQAGGVLILCDNTTERVALLGGQLCDNTTEKAALSCNMLWSQRPYEVVMSFTRSKPGPRAVRKIGRNLSGTTHPTLPPIGGRPSYSRPKRNCSDLE